MLPVSNNGELLWVKSSRSAGNGQCVEVAGTRDGVAVRDSKNPEGPSLRFQAMEWERFVQSVRIGEFDRQV